MTAGDLSLKNAIFGYDDSSPGFEKLVVKLKVLFSCSTVTDGWM